MTLRNALQHIKGLQYIVDSTPVLSPIGRRMLYATEWSSDMDNLSAQFSLIARTTSLLSELDKKQVGDTEHLISQVKDIANTINSLGNASVLTDIELFEIKCFSLISERIRAIIKDWDIVSLPNLQSSIDILDPERTSNAAFHIYNAYDTRLALLRSQLSSNCEDQSNSIFVKISSIEDEVRKNLTSQLRLHSDDLKMSLHSIGTLDTLIAKSKLNAGLNLSIPNLHTESTNYKSLFNPEIQSHLNQQGKSYQPIDVSFANEPTLITGINMGGKTVLLRTLALAQSMCQFGFYVPAQKADISLVDKIMMSIEDQQNHLGGLSSFASEMMTINDIITASKQKKNILVLIDELARTTNPTEGRAIVEAVVNILARNETRSFITTHYDGIKASRRRLRVKGLKAEIDNARHSDLVSESGATKLNIKQIDQLIDYSLVEDDSSDVPCEALNIARMIGIDEEFIAEAEKHLAE